MTQPTRPQRSRPRRSRPQRLVRTAAALAVVVAATTAVSGCSDQRLGAAAVVDGTRITTDDVQSLSRELLAVVPDQDPALVQRGVLDQLISDEVYTRVSRELGVSVSDGRVANQLQTLVTRFQGRKPLVRAILTSQARPEYVAPSMLQSWLRDQLLFVKVARGLAGGTLPTDAAASDALFQEADRQIAAIAADMSVDLSPRYGTWRPDRDVDPTVSDISPLVSGGLSRTADELSAGE